MKKLCVFFSLFFLCIPASFSLAQNKTERDKGISVNRTDEGKTIRIRPTLPADTGPEYNTTREIELDPEIYIRWKKD